MRSKGWYFFFEVFSVVFSAAAADFLISYGIGGTPPSDQRMFLGVDVVQFRQVIATLLAFGLATMASVLAAHVAKTLGPAEYEELNRRVHKWVVLGTNAGMFLTLATLTAIIEAWTTVMLLGVAVVLYGIFSKVITVRPHTFGARCRSVVLIRAPIALGLVYLLPKSDLRLVVSVLVFLVIGWAIGSLISDRKRYDWAWR